MRMAAESSDIQILPQACADFGTQKCCIPQDILMTLNIEVGSSVWVRISPIERFLCRVWPQSDPEISFMQPSSLVQEKIVIKETDHTEQIFINASDIEPVVDVGIVRTIGVSVVLTDYSKYSMKVGTLLNDLVAEVKHILMRIVLSEGCQVNCHLTELGKLFGISYILVNKLTSYKEGSAYGHIGADSKVQVDRVISKERFIQKHSIIKRKCVLGGLDRELCFLKELVELPAKCKECGTAEQFLFPGGVLLQGPPGCGKTSLVHRLASECDAYLQVVNGPEMYGAHPGETEANLRNIFSRVKTLSEEGLCILFLDEIDALCPARGGMGPGVERRVGSQLMQLLDDISSIRNFTVIGATNNPGNVDPAVRRAGRLEKEVLIGIPNISQRAKIVSVLTTHTPISPQVDLAWLAECTPGYVGADLVSLVQRAHQDAMKDFKKQNPGQLIKGAAPVPIQVEHLRSALHDITPSTQRGSDILVDHKPTQWHHIGGLTEVKDQIKQAIEWPLVYPEAFGRLGIPRPRGILLYGPPGCAKTTLVRAAATSCHVTFLAISGGQLYSPYVGDSEKKLTQVFQQARAGAPSILFIDEIDSVIGSRSRGGKAKGVQERVLSTLLNEMDGIGLRADDITKSGEKMAVGQESLDTVDSKLMTSLDNTDVLVVAATNRPDMLDDAILRPGRIDRIIYVPPPDYEARLSILQVHTRNIPLNDVDLHCLAKCTVGFTGADLENLCREAALQALSVDGLHALCVDQGHFDTVMSSQKPSLTSSQLQFYANLQSKLKLKSS